MHRVRGELAQSGMFSYRRLIGSYINAVYFVVRHVRLNPLNLRTHVPEYAAGRLGDGGKLLTIKRTCAWYIALYDEFRHGFLEFVNPTAILAINLDISKN